MTELDTGIPDGTIAPAAVHLSVSTENIQTKCEQLINSNADQQSDKGERFSNKENLVEAMEIDGMADAEECDSQITSSTDNGVSVCADSKMSEVISSKPTPIESRSAETSKAVREEQEETTIIDKSTVNVSSENSLNTCDGTSQGSLSKELTDSKLDSISNASNVLYSSEQSSENINNIGSEQNKHFKNEEIASIEVTSTNKVPEAGASLNDTRASEFSSQGDPLGSTESAEVEKYNLNAVTPENGNANDKQKTCSDGGVVDLDDDSDDDVAIQKNRNIESSNNTNSETLSQQASDHVAERRSLCSDSDGAVIIGSDSDNESPLPNMNTTSTTTGVQKTEAPQIIDDDDDDCVVIEDDAPSAPSNNDQTKRKSFVMDAANNSDDSQPPSKRQRSGTNQINTNQITIKDARSLMPHDMAKKNTEGGVYPVNITPAQIMPQGPPKLVPVGSIPSLPLACLPAVGSNTNLLPGLTDDMFVLEAPSFIVPYIYEKPPSDILRDIVREIETKYKLTKDDLADADKSDEFDMMTEQNKEDKEEKVSKKKKKRRGGDDVDESWSEDSDEDEEDEDDDDSEGGMRTKVLIKEASDDLTALKGAIKPAAAVAQSVANTSLTPKTGQENYFESPLGKFFMDIGVGLVQEFVQSDLIRLQKRKMRKSLGKNITEFERAISALSGNLEASKKKNSPFKFTLKRCEFCNFKSESALAMANHYETPHMNGPLYKCNFCTFEIRNATEIVYHMEAMHNIKARLIKPLPYHQCPNCGFEDNGKAKLARHQPVCAKKFRPELNLAPPNDWEAPAKIPRIKPRHGLVGTATAYQAMAAQAAAQKAALASIQQQQQVAQARSLQAAALAAQNAANKIRARQPTMVNKTPNGSAVLRGPNQVRSPMATNVVLPNNYQLAGGQLIQNLQTANALAKKTLSGQPSISITPLPRQSALPQVTSPSTSKMPPTGMKPGQSPTGNKAQFVICEICDGYIKDLEQLRNHMQWMHKVKIHPKMIYNRPPLNCQKCQFRFFTDQGLERHLLGSHGLVTSSMQEAANKGKDAGRCPVCGRMYQWKLLNHVSRDHHMTLKPAHLSYKCTVCTATFGMYKQFETHVYTAHSTVAKKAMDGKKNNSPATGTSVTQQRNNLGSSSDSLLKPLKINDEITIIPQPSSKPRIANIESHVID